MFSFTSILYGSHNKNCLTDLYKRDFQTTVILFIRNVSSDKTEWILTELPLLTLLCFLYRMVSSLMNALVGECLCLKEISINANKLLAVFLLPVYLFIRFLYVLHFVVVCLLLNPFFFNTDVIENKKIRIV